MALPSPSASIMRQVSRRRSACTRLDMQSDLDPEKMRSCNSCKQLHRTSVLSFFFCSARANSRSAADTSEATPGSAKLMA